MGHRTVTRVTTSWFILVGLFLIQIQKFPHSSTVHVQSSQVNRRRYFTRHSRIPEYVRKQKEKLDYKIRFHFAFSTSTRGRPTPDHLGMEFDIIDPNKGKGSETPSSCHIALPYEHLFKDSSQLVSYLTDVCPDSSPSRSVSSRQHRPTPFRGGVSLRISPLFRRIGAAFHIESRPRAVYRRSLAQRLADRVRYPEIWTLQSNLARLGLNRGNRHRKVKSVQHSMAERKNSTISRRKVKKSTSERLHDAIFHHNPGYFYGRFNNTLAKQQAFSDTWTPAPFYTGSRLSATEFLPNIFDYTALRNGFGPVFRNVAPRLSTFLNFQKVFPELYKRYKRSIGEENAEPYKNLSEAEKRRVYMEMFYGATTPGPNAGSEAVAERNATEKSTTVKND